MPRFEGGRSITGLSAMTISPLLIYICDEFECSAQRKGGLLSAYSLGYFCTQILGGLAADVVGPRAVMTAALVLSALATLATPEASASLGLAGVYATALLAGAAHGPLFPASVAYLARWLPSGERAWAVWQAVRHRFRSKAAG